MLTTSELITLAQRFHGQSALTAYIPLSPDVPTPNVVAQTLLRQGIARARQEHGSQSHDEREAFDAAAEHLMSSARETVHKQGGGTWVGFATPEGTIHAEMLDETLPALVEWDTQLRIVPYLSVCGTRSGLAVILDKQHATFYRYELGTLTELERFETVPDVETAPHMGSPPKLSFHPGTQGTTATDSANRQADNSFRRHAARIVHRITAHDRSGDWLVLGGPGEAVARVRTSLASGTTARTAAAESVSTSSSAAQVRDAVEAAVGGLRTEHEKQLVSELMDRPRGPALSALGRDTVAFALEQRAVGTLAMSRAWVENHERDAEELVNLALAQDAAVEIVSDGSFEIGAKLRFAVGQTVAAAG